MELYKNGFIPWENGSGVMTSFIGASVIIFPDQMKVSSLSHDVTQIHCVLTRPWIGSF